MEKLEQFGTLYIIVYIVSSVIAVLFSGFMMYTLWKTQRVVTRAAKNITKMADDINKGLPVLVDVLSQKNNYPTTEFPQLSEEELIKLNSGGEEIPPGGFMAEKKSPGL